MGFAMELILTPIIHRMIEEEQSQLKTELSAVSALVWLI